VENRAYHDAFALSTLLGKRGKTNASMQSFNPSAKRGTLVRAASASSALGSSFQMFAKTR
jgi:hypothetical protein